MHRAFLLIIVIGIFSGALASAEVELSPEGGSLKKGFIYVEPNNVNAVKVDEEYALKPYLERRRTWGFTASVAYSTFEPTHYKPNFISPADFGQVYHSPEMPMLELQMQLKRNVSFGSLAVEAAVGDYKVNSDIDTTLVKSSLNLIPVRLGVNVALDALSSTPYVVPYVSAGIYTISYKESQESASKNGNTQIAPYANFGLQFALDWVDKDAARKAYEDSSIQATYIFVDARKQMASGNSKDPDFSNDISFGTGLRLEF
jgi:hypothetical protein